MKCYQLNIDMCIWCRSYQGKGCLIDRWKQYVVPSSNTFDSTKEFAAHIIDTYLHGRFNTSPYEKWMMKAIELYNKELFDMIDKVRILV